MPPPGWPLVTFLCYDTADQSAPRSGSPLPRVCPCHQPPTGSKPLRTAVSVRQLASKALLAPLGVSLWIEPDDLCSARRTSVSTSVKWGYEHLLIGLPWRLNGTTCYDNMAYYDAGATLT